MSISELYEKVQLLKTSFEKHLGTGIYCPTIENIVRNLTNEDYIRMVKKS